MGIGLGTGDESTTAVLDARGLSKTFPGHTALSDVWLRVMPGEIFGLVGHNGSGKSTLIKILSGYHTADPGAEVTVCGVPLRGRTRHARHRERIRFIHQDLGLIPSLSIAENIAIGGRGFATGRLGRIRWRAQLVAARAALQGYDIDCDPRTIVNSLAPGEQTMVAIARALSGWDESHGLLVLDEPTAALHPSEVGKLAGAVRTVAARGCGVIFVSHRIGEVLDLADRIGVLRDGVLVAEGDRRDFTADGLINLIAGRELADLPQVQSCQRQRVRLSVRDLATASIRDLGFDLHEGEILGVAGVLGSGREELAGSLIGSPEPLKGVVSLHGQLCAPLSPRSATRRGIVFLPADRARSLFPTLTARENLTLPMLAPLLRGGRLSRRAETADATLWIDELRVEPAEPERPIVKFSGGNQQKIALGRWLRTAPQVLLFDEPTRGVDVGAKQAIYGFVKSLAANGGAVLVTSSDSKELATLCDRVIVLRGGRLGAELSGTTLSESSIIVETLTESRR